MGTSYYNEESLQLSHTYWSNGDIRLVPSGRNDDTPITSGRLEVYIDTLLAGERRKGGGERRREEVGSGAESLGVWGTVCGKGFTLREAHVACKQLGFSSAEMFVLSSATQLVRERIAFICSCLLMEVAS